MTALNEVEIPDGHDVSLVLNGDGYRANIDGALLTIRDNPDGEGFEITYDGNYALVTGMTEATHALSRWL